MSTRPASGLDTRHAGKWTDVPLGTIDYDERVAILYALAVGAQCRGYCSTTRRQIPMKRSTLLGRSRYLSMCQLSRSATRRLPGIGET